MSDLKKILVSACLLGERVRYDGQASRLEDQILERWIQEERVVSFCPECAGQLPVPRPAAEITGGEGADVLRGEARVITRSSDVSDHFLIGAQAALQRCKLDGIRIAVLKEKSPSCGSAQIYDGTFTRTLRHGDGVTTALLREHGIEIFGETQLAEADAALRR